MNLTEYPLATIPICPAVILTDFDRTLTYLYKDTQLLLELADKMIAYYGKFTVVPEALMAGDIDGYHVWHALHTHTEERLPADKASTVNHGADELVAEFERIIIERVGLFDGVAETIRELGK